MKSRFECPWQATCDLCMRPSGYYSTVSILSFSHLLITLQTSSNTFQSHVFELPVVSHLANSRELTHIPHLCAQRHLIKEPCPSLKLQLQKLTHTIPFAALTFFTTIVFDTLFSYAYYCLYSTFTENKNHVKSRSKVYFFFFSCTAVSFKNISLLDYQNTSSKGMRLSH